MSSPCPLPTRHIISCASVILNYLQSLKGIVWFHRSLILDIYASWPRILFLLPTSNYSLSKSLRIILSNFFLTSALKFFPTPGLMRYLLLIFLHSLINLFLDSIVHSYVLQTTAVSPDEDAFSQSNISLQSSILCFTPWQNLSISILFDCWHWGKDYA